MLIQHANRYGYRVQFLEDTIYDHLIERRSSKHGVRPVREPFGAYPPGHIYTTDEHQEINIRTRLGTIARVKVLIHELSHVVFLSRCIADDDPFNIADDNDNIESCIIFADTLVRERLNLAPSGTCTAMARKRYGDIYLLHTPYVIATRIANEIISLLAS